MFRSQDTEETTANLIHHYLPWVLHERTGAAVDRDGLRENWQKRNDAQMVDLNHNFRIDQFSTVIQIILPKSSVFLKGPLV